jgi:hypothetical protein
VFYPRDHQIYDESYDVAPAAARIKGQPEQIEDVFGFWLTDTKSDVEGNLLRKSDGTLPEQTLVYKMRQVLADKLTGSGEEIPALARVYAVVAQNHYITANPAGVAGIDYYYCGISKFAAEADDLQVIINFDGTRYDENI